MLASLSANVPTWWADFGVGPDSELQPADAADEASDANKKSVMDGNYQPALLGQAKFMAYQAYQAMEAEEQGSAGPEIEDMVLGFSTDEEDNYQILLLGQLKRIAMPFYTRFAERGYDVAPFGIRLTLTDEPMDGENSVGDPQAVYPYAYPWIDPFQDSVNYDMDQNYQPANVGQMKYLFSFDLAAWGSAPTMVVNTVDGLLVSTLGVTLSGEITTTNFGSLTVNGDAIDEVTSTGIYSFEYPLANEGENVLTIVFEDNSGNRIENAITVYRDTEAPILNFSTPAGDVYYTNMNSISFVGTVDDPAATLMVNGSLITISGNSFSHNEPLVLGNNRFEFEGGDALGNVRTYVKTVVYDDAVPVVFEPSIPFDQDFYTNQSTLSYGGALSESSTLYVNGDQVALSDDGEFAFLHDVALIEGENTVTIRVIDTAGNSINKTITVYYDVTPPVFASLLSDLGQFVNTSTVTVSGAIDDPDATVSINGSSVTVNGDGSFSGAVTLSLGNNLITALVTDQAGNSSTQTIEIIYDTTSPQILSLSPDESFATSAATYTFTGVLDDADARLVVTGGATPVTVDSASVLPTGEFTVIVPLIAGSNPLIFTVTDLAQNSSDLTLGVELDQQTIAPVINNAPAFAYISGDRITSLTGTAELGVEVAVLGGLSPVVVTADPTTGAFDASNILLRLNQINDLTIRATDLAGNQAETYLRVVSDTIAPVLVLDSPSSAVVGSQFTLLAALADANPSSSISAVLDGGSPITVSADAPGQYATIFNGVTAGAHTLTLSAIDAAGNLATDLVHDFSVTDSGVDAAGPLVTVVSTGYDTVIDDGVSFNLTLLLSDETGIATVNGDPVTLTDGRVTVPVTANANGEIALSVVDTAATPNTTDHIHTVDLTAIYPALVLKSPSDQIPISESAVTVYIQTTANTPYSVSGGGLPVVLDGVSASNGLFSVDLPLLLNQENTFTVTAAGLYGVSSELSVVLVHDSVRPEMGSTIPANDSTQVALASSIDITFSEVIEPLPASLISLTSNGQPVNFTVSFNHDLSNNLTVLTIDPESDFADSADIQVSLPDTITDAAGNQISGERSFTFSTLDSELPDAPANLVASQAYTNQDTVIITGTAEPSSTISVIGSSDDSVTTVVDVSGQFTLTVSLALGDNTLKLKATDTTGNESSDSEDVVVTRYQLQVSVTSPANTTGILIDSAIELTFSEVLDAETLSSIALVTVVDSAGVSVVDTALTHTEGTAVVNLTPTSALVYGTNYQIIIPISVRDVFGGRLDTTETLAFSTNSDVAAPIIYSSTPQGYTNQTSVLISGYATPGTIVTSSGGSATATTGEVNHTGLFDLNVSLNLSQTNTITLTAAFASGTPSGASAEVVIVQDDGAPSVSSVSPNGATDVALTAPISVTFSEPVDLASLTEDPSAVRLLDGNNLTVPGDWFQSASNVNQLVFHPFRALDPSTTYIIVVDQNLRDLSGNRIASSVQSTFTTVTDATLVDLLAAPILDPLGFDRTITPTITLQGSATAGMTLRVLGGASAAQTIVDTDNDNDGLGRFSVLVPLIPDAVNNMVVYVEDASGKPGFSATVTVTHYSHDTGIRILSPQAGLEYNNRSVMITGALDNAVEIERVTVSDINGGPEEEAALIGSYFARQIVLADYSLMSGTPTPSTRTLIINVIDPDTEQLDFHFYAADGTLKSYPNVTAGLTDQEGLDAVTQLIANLSVAEPDRNDSQIIADAMAIVQHSIDEGSHTVTVTAHLTNGSTETQLVTFDLYIQPAGGDTRPPQVTFLYPETGEVIAEEIIETFMVVEEGVQLSTVDIGGVVAHQSVGNFFLIYAVPEAQGVNTLTARAKDYTGNEGSADVEVFFDSIPPAVAPVLDASSLALLGGSSILERVVTLTGTGEVGSVIYIENGLVPVRTTVVDDGDSSNDGGDYQVGTWSIQVPVVDNSSNTISVYASDAAGNITELQTYGFVHDDTQPYPTGSIPEHGQSGVAPNGSIFVTFSEPLDPSSVTTSSVKLARENPTIAAGAKTEISNYNVRLSADGMTIEIIPSYSFERAETIIVDLLSTLQDVNHFQMADPYTFSFDTALYQTILSGVVIDPAIQALQNVKVGILGSDIYQYTSSFGTFILDEVPLGEQTLYIDARPDAATGIPPQGDAREFGYLEFPVYINEGAANSLGRPIFMVDTDFSTTTPLFGTAGPLTFDSTVADLDGFEIDYTAGSARFADGTDRGDLTVTRIGPANIPDRLPDGSIPHFLVEIGARDLTFSTPQTVRFPNVYDLGVGEEVIVFYFDYGLGAYQELVPAPTDGRSKYTVDSTGNYIDAPILTQAGFYGYIPASGDYDLTRAYLVGRVVDGNGNGLEGISVNAIAGSSYVLTDAEGYYRIPMPEVRLLRIQTFATISTRGSGSEDAPDLVYASAQVDLLASGTTTVPDILIDSFTLQGNIRYVDTLGQIVQTTGFVQNGGVVTGVDVADTKAVDIYVYRRLSNQQGISQYDSAPYMQALSNRDDLLDSLYHGSFEMLFRGSLDDPDEADSGESAAPKPGDILKVVAFDHRTGFYGETEIEIQPPAGGSNALSLNIDLRPPQLSVDVNRVFYIDSTRRRANVPHQGIVFTDDEFIEFKTTWRTADAVPLARPELALSARLRVDSIDYASDYPFDVLGGDQFRVLEIREALYTDRLDVLQRETDVGTETFSISRNGSFNQESLIPMEIRSDSYGLSQSTSGAVASGSQTEMQINIIDFSVEEDGDDLAISGRAKAGQGITIGGTTTLTADANGFFSGSINGSLTADGLELGLGSGPNTRYGASYTPVINQLTDSLSGLDPARGSQGESVTINGEYFSPVPEDNKVSFNGTPAEVVSASESQLTVLVPDAASSGPVTVTVAGKISNGMPFEFISYGINDGSFESGFFKAFTVSGGATVVESLIEVSPTDRQFMALLHTQEDPVSGVSTITTDRFVVTEINSNVPYFVFDYNLMGTALTLPFESHVEIYVINENNEMISVSETVFDVSPMNALKLTGYNKASGFLTASVDLANAGVSDGDLIRIHIELKGRGRLPEYMPGTAPDDLNPIDMTKRQGTALLLDNMRLSAPFPSVDLIDTEVFEQMQFEVILLEDYVRINSTQLLPIGARVFVADLLSGQTESFDVNFDGNFSILLKQDIFLSLIDPSGSIDGPRSGYLALWYRTEDRSEAGEPSSSIYSGVTTYELSTD